MMQSCLIIAVTSPGYKAGIYIWGFSWDVQNIIAIAILFWWPTVNRGRENYV